MVRKANLQIPTKASRNWNQVKILGSGGQGTVFEVSSKLDQRRGALKILKKSNPYHVERFLREIEILKSVQHPNIVELWESSLEPTPYYIMPLGQNLEEHWSKKKWTSPEEQFDLSYHLINKVLDGLEVLHKKLYVHRDIKPANILILADSNIPVLADLGIVHVPEKERITKMPAGTQFARFLPAHYSPELAPPAIDCYGVACLWSWLLALKPKTAPGNYHWRHHQFINDPRCEIVRAILAICTDHPPENAMGFKNLMFQRFHLENIVIKKPVEIYVNEAIEAYAAAHAKQQLSESRVIESISTTSYAVSALVKPIFEVFKSVTVPLVEANLPISYRTPELTLEDIATSITQGVLDSREMDSKELTLAVVQSITSALAEFKLEFNVVWNKHPHENGSEFSFHLNAQHARSPEITGQIGDWYNVLPDGSIPDLEREKVIENIVRFLSAPDLWQEKKGPFGILPSFAWWGPRSRVKEVE